MKTPEEIKASLLHCAQSGECIKCSYYREHDTKYTCLDRLLPDVITLIQQLETQIIRCIDCKHSAIDAYSNRRMCIRNGEIKPNGRIWFGVAVNDDHFCGYGERPKEE